MPTLVGSLLSGRYRLDAQVGTGGMSTVYRAFDKMLERQVAIKLMHREIAADPDQLERFRREARAVAQLIHPHIVTVIDAGEDDGMRTGRRRPYIVFEYVEGETLKERIRRCGRLPCPRRSPTRSRSPARWAPRTSAASSTATSSRRTSSIDEEGTAKVTDFGIARTLDEEGLTADGRVLGTTDYVSPEQALGHAVTGQSDLYSLGIVLFEMLTGDVPFRGENQVAVAMKHVREELPDVQVRRPEVSAALAAVLDRATAKDLDRRYATDARADRRPRGRAGDRDRALGPATGEATAVLRTLPATRRRRLPLRMRHPALARRAGRWSARSSAVVIVLARPPTAPSAAPAPRRRRRRPGLARSRSSQTRRATTTTRWATTASTAARPSAVLDGDANTTWSTESYNGGDCSKAGRRHLRRRRARASPRRALGIRTADARAGAPRSTRRDGSAPPDDSRRLEARRRRPPRSTAPSGSTSTPPASGSATT